MRCLGHSDGCEWLEEGSRSPGSASGGTLAVFWILGLGPARHSSMMQCLGVFSSLRFRLLYHRTPNFGLHEVEYFH
ncbi:hypothetical protein BO94DRAFT_537731 [Aspergillus sclerotioniger CBS 115572]|uniref:Uncharacterized protein n=1 Tax=Aspergillus sclerotioniger CBS 115572 TaxID=1450535 RepID=A0A317VY30_9EURO|nr:hypothetical protein BO94DRAFT_537731 [Aspergillus sclerotioniger CBS 115572]PWY78539.1 hypothetical protein BO94DRAFT_537731 [Aspergillus sclerotioniger CBS 115572]